MAIKGTISIDLIHRAGHTRILPWNNGSSSTWQNLYYPALRGLFVGFSLLSLAVLKKGIIHSGVTIWAAV